MAAQDPDDDCMKFNDMRAPNCSDGPTSTSKLSPSPGASQTPWLTCSHPAADGVGRRKTSAWPKIPLINVCSFSHRNGRSRSKGRKLAGDLLSTLLISPANLEGCGQFNRHGLARNSARIILLVLCFFVHEAQAAQITPVVEAEEDVYRYEPANNGAGPMWCHGSTCLVRVGEDVVASGLETLTNQPPLNNCRWTLWRREVDGWRQTLADANGRTREPCPLATFPKQKKVFLSANPTLSPPGQAGGGPARPEILEFRLPELGEPAAVLLPEWDGKPDFTEHSYRSFAADGQLGELIIFQNIGYTHAEYAYRDASGRWAARGQLKWPWGAEYDKPQPIRVCYPNVALVKGAVHFVGVSDIVEPYGKWREFKKQLTGRDWDYDFRRLFYARCADIRRGEFVPWIELASRDKTCGWISPGDLWVGPDGRVHIVWTERAIDERLREKFFPDQKQRHEANYAVLKDGIVELKRTFAAVDEGQRGVIVSLPRFHATPEGRLFVFCYVSGTGPDGKGISENWLYEVSNAGDFSAPVKVPLKHSLSSYFTATVRAGSEPSRWLDLLGTRVGASGTISYARIRL